MRSDDSFCAQILHMYMVCVEGANNRLAALTSTVTSALPGLLTKNCTEALKLGFKVFFLTGVTALLLPHLTMQYGSAPAVE